MDQKIRMNLSNDFAPSTNYCSPGGCSPSQYNVDGPTMYARTAPLEAIHTHWIEDAAETIACLQYNICFGVNYSAEYRYYDRMTRSRSDWARKNFHKLGAPAEYCP